MSKYTSHQLHTCKPGFICYFIILHIVLLSLFDYLFQAFYFDKSDVALPGLHKYFKKLSDDEREHALKLIAYQNKRGGAVILTDIKSPQHNDWGSAEEAMTAALELEKKVNEVYIVFSL